MLRGTRKSGCGEEIAGVRKEEGLSKEEIGRVLDGLREGKTAGLEFRVKYGDLEGREYGIGFGSFATGYGGGRKSHNVGGGGDRTHFEEGKRREDVGV